jgi:hypothetical protein
LNARLDALNSVASMDDAESELLNAVDEAEEDTL